MNQQQQTQQTQQATDFFPMPPARHPDATIYIFGCQILHYILSSQPAEVYGLLADQDLRDAHYACRYALCAPEILPIAVERISQVQFAITRVLDRRAAELDAKLAQLDATGNSHQGDPGKPGSSKVPVHPAPSGPGAPDALVEPTREPATREIVF